MNLHRHGEVTIIPVDKIPKEAKLVEQGNSLIVGHSESGHNHILTVPKTAEIKMFEFEGRTYLDIPLEAKLVHQKEIEKHGMQILQPGLYERIIKKSFSYVEKAMRRVTD